MGRICLPVAHPPVEKGMLPPPLPFALLLLVAAAAGDLSAVNILLKSVPLDTPSDDATGRGFMAKVGRCVQCNAFVLDLIQAAARPASSTQCAVFCPWGQEGGGGCREEGNQATGCMDGLTTRRSCGGSGGGVAYA